MNENNIIQKFPIFQSLDTPGKFALSIVLEFGRFRPFIPAKPFLHCQRYTKIRELYCS